LIDVCVTLILLAATISLGWRVLIDGVATHLESDDPIPTRRGRRDVPAKGL